MHNIKWNILKEVQQYISVRQIKTFKKKNLAWHDYIKFWPFIECKVYV